MQEFTGEIDAVAFRDVIIQAIDIAVSGKKSSESDVLPSIKIRLKEIPQEPRKVPAVDLKPLTIKIQTTQPLSIDRLQSAVQQISKNHLVSYCKEKTEEDREKLRLAYEQLEKRAEQIRLYAEKVRQENLQQP